MISRRCWLPLFLLVGVASHRFAFGQIDPEKRRLVQIGFNQPLEGKGPIGGYGFYYHNQPHFYSTNLTLRLAVAPVYLDADLGFTGLLGPNTDVSLGFSGGGFAESYSEIRQGKFLQAESFIGHGFGFSASVYHRLNPDKDIPLWLVARGTVHQSYFEEDSRTDDFFEVPSDRNSFSARTGLRLGGQEPSMTEPLALEISFWHESQFRTHSDHYGYGGDRLTEEHSHLFWARALLKYMLPGEQFFEFSLITGTGVHTDRFSAYRLGGVLPFASEFPLNIPGYYFQEISAQSFGLLNAQYSFPVIPSKCLRLAAFGAGGPVDYLDGLEQSGHWHSGIGAGLTYISPTGSWLASLIFGHGFTGIRNFSRGSNQVGFILQYDFEAVSRGKSRFFIPGNDPYRSRGGERIFWDSIF